MKKYLSLLAATFFVIQCCARDADSILIKKIYKEALTNSQCYQWLDHISNKIGGRLSGSKESIIATDYVFSVLNSLGADTVYRQEVQVPHWVRGKKEYACIFNGKEKIPVNICALGGSIATPKKGMKAEVIEIKNFDELEKAGRDKINGKIVFFNHPLEPSNYNTFVSYGEAGKYRFAGAAKAAAYGAAGVIVRSLTLSIDDFPHTGMMAYADSVPEIPACAVSTKGAELLSGILKKNNSAQLMFQLNCSKLPDAIAYNVIAEIRGSEFPDEIILAGGHLDSWDTGKGAHDDGAGVVQCMEMISLLKKLNIKPRRTIRCVLFANEENGGKGGEKYAELALKKKEKNIAAIETDAGGFTPRGFSFKGDSLLANNVIKHKNLFSDYGLHEWKMGYGGADIEPLKKQGTLLIGLSVDTQRYFDYHHTANDTFDKVNKRELELGAASITSLALLIAEYGLQ